MFSIITNTILKCENSQKGPQNFLITLYTPLFYEIPEGDISTPPLPGSPYNSAPA